MALLNLVDDISEELNNKNHSIGVFIDLSKAFDTIDHKLLMQKLDHYGVRGVAINWFTSYLTDRTQYVCIGDSTSTPLPITCGVPQGSILGPLLFIIYINDIVNSSKLATYVMFADDTNLFFKHKNLITLYELVNNELLLISEWSKLNKLSLNIKKTSYILFHGIGNKIDISGLHINIDSMIIEQVDKAKFVGVVTNSKIKLE